MALLEPEFGGVLDGDDAFAVGDQAGEGVEQGGLAGAGGAGDDDVEPGADQPGQQQEHPLVQGAQADHLVEGVGAGEAADGEGGAGQGERRDDDVDALAGGEPGVDHGVGLVDPAVDGGDDAFDGLHQLLGGGEADGEALDPAGPFHEHLIGSVDHDLGDGGVLQQRFQDAQAQGLVHDAADEERAFVRGQHGAFPADDVPQDPLQPDPALGRGEGRHLREVDLLQQLGAVDRDEVALLLPAAGRLGSVDARPQAHR